MSTEKDKVLCFHTLSQVLILKELSSLRTRLIFGAQNLRARFNAAESDKRKKHRSEDRPLQRGNELRRQTKFKSVPCDPVRRALYAGRQAPTRPVRRPSL